MSLIVVAKIALAFGRPLRIQRNANGFVARFFRPLDPAFGQFFVPKRIQLNPEMAIRSLGQVFKRCIGIGADGENSTARRRGAIGGQFSFGMCALMTSTRSDQYRQFHLGAEHSSGKIERAYVAQDTWPKGPGGKCAAISIDAELVRG